MLEKEISSVSCGDGVTPALAGFTDWKECIDCGDDVHIERWALGYKWCKFCGEDRARTERNSWCIIQEYGKGNYQYVTSTSAPTTLQQTNQKHIRG